MKRLGLGLAIVALCAVSGAQAKTAVPLPGMEYVDKAADFVSGWLPAPTLERFCTKKDASGRDEDPHLKAGRVSRYGSRNATLAFYALLTYNAVQWARNRAAKKKHHA